MIQKFIRFIKGHVSLKLQALKEKIIYKVHALIIKYIVLPNLEKAIPGFKPIKVLHNSIFQFSKDKPRFRVATLIKYKNGRQNYPKYYAYPQKELNYLLSMYR